MEKQKKSIISEIERSNNEFQKEKKAKEQEIKQSNDTYNLRKAEIDAYSSLRTNGIDDDTIKRWNKIVDASKHNLHLIELELRENANLEKLKEEKTKDIADLEKKKAVLTSEAEELETNKKKIVDSIEQIKDVTIRKIEDAEGAAKKRIEEGGKELVNTLSAAAQEYAKRFSQAENFEEELKLARLIIALTNFPSEAKGEA